jgi:hypothetical protein
VTKNLENFVKFWKLNLTRETRPRGGQALLPPFAAIKSEEMETVDPSPIKLHQDSADIKILAYIAGAPPEPPGSKRY